MTSSPAMEFPGDEVCLYAIYRTLGSFSLALIARVSRSRACARFLRSHELSMVILGLNNAVKKRLDLAAT